MLLALMITMIRGGLWHEAGLNFIIWGALHGLYLVLNVLWDRMGTRPVALESSTPRQMVAREPRRLLRLGGFELWKGGSTAAQLQAPPSKSGSRLRAVLGWLVTFIAVNYAWLYFRAPTFGGAMAANRKIGAWLLHPPCRTSCRRLS